MASARQSAARSVACSARRSRRATSLVVTPVIARRPTLTLSPLAIVVLLGVTQIVGYGTLYYSYAILAGDVASAFGLQVSTVMGVFSLALLVGGVMAPIAGRSMDRHGAPRMMAWGSFGAGITLLLVALAPNGIAFLAAMILAEMVAALVLYDAAFAALVQLCGLKARLRITHLTLIAGLASTLFWPLTTRLHETFDWRVVFAIFAGLNLVLCLPIHALLTRVAARPEPPPPADAALPTVDGPPPPLPEDQRRRVFTLVAWGFALSGFLLSAMLTQMVPMLTALGLGASALLVSTLFGPAQVLVRFVNMVFGVRSQPLTLALLVALLLPAAVIILGLSAPAAAGAAVFAILLGFGSGLKSIVQGTLPLALFGAAGYGAMLGKMAFARQFLGAVAPFAFAFTLERAGAMAALMLTVAVALAGLGCFLAVVRILSAAGRARPITP